MDVDGGAGKKLWWGVYLKFGHQEVAERNCEHCQIYLYDEKTGFVERQQAHGVVGDPIKRSPKAPAPCRTKVGCLKGTPERQEDLSKQNQRALLHFIRCETTGVWPDDSRVMRNAEIIAAARLQAKERRAWIDKQVLHKKLETLAASLGGSIALRALS